mgnify:CR=1 FL=1
MLIHNELKNYDFEANERVRLYREKEGVYALTIFDIVTCDGLTVLWTFYSNYDRENNVSRYTSFFESIHFHFLEYGWISDKQVRNFSNKERANNFNGETFCVDKIIPLSAQSAMVVYKKTTGKKALAHFIHIRKKKRWIYYFMGAAHFLNLNLLTEKYAEIEEYNFPLNFDHIPKESHESDLPEM